MDYTFMGSVVDWRRPKKESMNLTICKKKFTMQKYKEKKNEKDRTVFKNGDTISECYIYVIVIMEGLVRME